jgi:hypothetical protein
MSSLFEFRASKILIEEPGAMESSTQPDSKTASSRGGPKTAAGKATSALNSLKHGARASPARMEALVGEDRFADMRDKFRHALGLTGPVEDAIGQELARSAIAMELAGAALDLAVRRLAALHDAVLATGSPAMAAAALDLDGLDPGYRYGTAAARRFERGLRTLFELRRQGTSPAAGRVPASQYAAEELRRVFADEHRRAEFLATAFNKRIAGPALNGDGGTESDSIDSCSFRDPRAKQFRRCYLAQTGLDHKVALLAALEWMLDPSATLNDLGRRCGMAGTRAFRRLILAIRSADELGRDWCLIAIHAALKSPPP